MAHDIDSYLRELQAALRSAGADPALVQDALFDAEEYLQAEMAAGGEFATVAEGYGSPEEVAAAYLGMPVSGAPAALGAEPAAVAIGAEVLARREPSAGERRLRPAAVPTAAPAGAEAQTEAQAEVTASGRGTRRGSGTDLGRGRRDGGRRGCRAAQAPRSHRRHRSHPSRPPLLPPPHPLPSRPSRPASRPAWPRPGPPPRPGQRRSPASGGRSSECSSTRRSTRRSST